MIVSVALSSSAEPTLLIDGSDKLMHEGFQSQYKQNSKNKRNISFPQYTSVKIWCFSAAVSVKAFQNENLIESDWKCGKEDFKYKKNNHLIALKPDFSATESLNWVRVFFSNHIKRLHPNKWKLRESRRSGRKIWVLPLFGLKVRFCLWSTDDLKESEWTQTCFRCNDAERRSLASQSETWGKPRVSYKHWG